MFDAPAALTASTRSRSFRRHPFFCESETAEDVHRHDFVSTPGRKVGRLTAPGVVYSPS